MESRSTFARSLVICGTACVLASLAALAYAMHLSSADAQDHRRQVVALFERPGSAASTSRGGSLRASPWPGAVSPVASSCPGWGWAWG
ncbi:MAG: hypothetical protein WKF75_10935 [Singulisphaera sp.]